ncbi:MAG: Uma2 family endonuclease [Caldilineaceae bacterium SB0664_bin_22]|nr:Uma2 family endonuclease [Caldilineaceae bacterium SB0664_bin_22]
MAMATNVRADTQVQSGNGRVELQPEPWDWHVAARRGDTDAATALAARARRTAWRMAHPDVWRAELEMCDHYDLAYVYDEAHEYDFDWTTDPDYPFDVRHNAYDQDGFVCPEHEWHLLLLARMFPVLCDLFDDIEVVRVLNKPDLYNPEALGKALGLRTAGGLTKEMVRPDVLVLPAGARLQQARVLRIAQGDPVPELAIEIVSPTSRDQDFDDKLRLYAALGIWEYLVCNAGSRPQGDDPGWAPDLRLFRQPRDGMYEQMDVPDPVRTDDGDFLTITVRSEVCGTELRLHQANPRTLPQFQWWDQGQDRWWDPEADARMEERTDTAIAMLHRVLPDDAGPALRERIAECWRAEGPPEDVIDRLLDVQLAPRECRSLLDIPLDDEFDRDDQGPDHMSIPA